MGRRRRDQFGGAAGPVNADHLVLAPGVARPPRMGAGVRAESMGQHRDPVADLPVGHAVADRRHHAGGVDAGDYW